MSSRARRSAVDTSSRTFLRASVGRHREEATLQRADEALVAVALADLHTVLGPGLPPPVATHVQRWGGGLPQYAVGHLGRVARIRAATTLPIAVGFGVRSEDQVRALAGHCDAIVVGSALTRRIGETLDPDGRATGSTVPARCGRGW